MIRILHIVTNMDVGGIETMLINYHRNINRDKLQFDYLVHREKKAAYDDEILKLGGKIYRLPKLNPFSLNYRKKLNDFFKIHNEYKIVHCHLNYLCSLPLYYAMKNGVPNRISHSHTAIQLNYSPKNIIKKYYKNKLSRYTTKKFACSIKAGYSLYDSNDFSIFYNAIDAKKYIYNIQIRNKIRKSLQIKDELIIGNVGRLYYKKNQSFLIDVFDEIIKNKHNARLLLVGSGSEEELLKNKVSKLKLNDKVLFLGTRNNVNELLQAMDVFVLPSLIEGLGIVAIEAQAAGLPCVVSNAVPDDCIITDLVSKCSLKESPKTWAKLILEKSNAERRNTYNEIVDAGYDIVSNARKLENFYLNLYSTT